MRRSRLLAVMLSTVLVAALSASPAHAQGAGLPGYLPPGEYTCSSSFATFNTVLTDGENVSVGINDSNCKNQPKPGFTFPPGGQSANLTVNVFNPVDFSFFQGCYFISPADFLTNQDLSSWTLITTITDTTPGCGFQNNIPAGTVISLQWLGTGPIASTTDEDEFNCTAYFQEVQSSSSNNIATVSGTIPGVLSSPLSNVPGFITEGEGDTHVSGVPDQTCPPGGNGVGRGAGPGPLPAGDYQFNTNQAFATFQSADFTQFIELIATAEVDVANPQGGSIQPPASGARTAASGARTSGGPVTTGSTQLEIRIEDFNTFTFENACYIVAPGLFTANGITSATLHVLLDGSQAPCPNSFDQQNVPLPLTVDASWTGTGPSAPNRDTNQFDCATYNTQSTSLINAVTAANKFTLPELFPGQEFDSTPDSPGALSTRNLMVHATGVDPQACIVRG